MEQQFVSDEVTQRREQEPPSYFPTQQQGPLLPQEGYIIQNVPVGTQEECCGGRSERFRDKVGFSTGVLQIVLAVAVIIISTATTVNRYHEYGVFFYPFSCFSIVNATVLILPAGILGACTKKRSSCVIIGYLVMSILAAVHSSTAAGLEGSAAAFYSFGYSRCSDHINHSDMSESEGLYFTCAPHRVVSITVLHSITAFLSLVEFIVAIFAAAFCCGGLSCCCAGSNPAQHHAVPMMYYPVPTGGPQNAIAQANVDHGAEPIPSKA